MRRTTSDLGWKIVGFPTWCDSDDPGIGLIVVAVLVAPCL